MKKTCFLLLLSCTAFFSKAQRVGIGTAVPDSSAILELKSTNKGVLLPRVFLTSLFDSTTIPKPAVSLLVYNTNKTLHDGAGYYAWNGNSWDVLLSTGNEYKRGKNRYQTVVDGDVREYFVHVPESYSTLTPTPMVMMLHGTGGNGEKFYNISGWKETGEDENILTVFPSSWRYLIFDSAIKNTTKWNVQPDAEWVFMPGQTGRDDIKFLRRIITEMKLRFNIDTTRMYLEGFSNGGQMAAKCAIEMGDQFAAVCENAGSFFIDTVYTPVRKLPVLFQIGNEDFGPGNTATPVNLSNFDTLLHIPGNFYYRVKRAHVRNFGLDSVYTLSGNVNLAMVADFHGTPGDTLNVFKFIFVKGLNHQFPNGENHWMEGARVHWAWMRRFRRL